MHQLEWSEHNQRWFSFVILHHHSAQACQEMLFHDKSLDPLRIFSIP